MAGTVGLGMVHTGIVLTVTGVSRCISIEGYAAASFAPWLAGSGGAVAFDAPVVAEACGMGSIAAVDDVDVRVVGRGLYYSSAGLGRGLAQLAAAAYLEGEDAVKLDLAPDAFEPGRPLEAILASISGSSVAVAGERFPLGDLQGMWAVVVRLEKPVPTARLYEEVYARGGPAEDVAAVLDEGVEGLRRLGLAYAGYAGRRAQSLVRRALRAGAEAAYVDSTGRLLVALVEDYEDAVMLSTRLRRLGPRYEAEVVA